MADADTVLRRHVAGFVDAADALAIFLASSPARSRSVTILLMPSTRRRSEAVGWRLAMTWAQSSSMAFSDR